MTLRIVVHLSAARTHMGGGALSMWRLADTLRAAGHAVRVTASQVMSRRVRGVPVAYLGDDAVRWADVILTTAGIGSTPVYRTNRKHRRPVVAFAHSAVRPLRCHGADLLVWGSASLQKRMRDKGFSTEAQEMVLWPSFDPESVRVEPGDCVTLVNLTPEKGARLFWALADRMPDVCFLGVTGGGDVARQVVPHPRPANVEVMDYSTDPRDAYRRTRLLLYMRAPGSDRVGLTAIEAAASGIPTVAHPGPGLLESLGDCGIWVHSDDPAEWESAIRATLDPDAYGDASNAARSRAEHYRHESDVSRLMHAIENLTGAPT